MTEFQEFVKDAPEFALMERGELAIYAYAMYAAGAKMESENAKLRELVRILYYCNLPWSDCDKCAMNGADMHVKISDIEFCDGMYDRMSELGVEVDG